eukprot:Nk52_evm10s161 gene=Nk52_evmTU10s161
MQRSASTSSLLNATIDHIQDRISNYDKASWERLAEQEEFDGLEGLQTKVSNKTGKVKPELIDVDLIKGSTFFKEKTSALWPQLIRIKFFQCMFFPFFPSLWIRETSLKVWLIATVLYFIQLGILLVLLMQGNQDMCVNQVHLLLPSGVGESGCGRGLAVAMFEWLGHSFDHSNGECSSVKGEGPMEENTGENSASEEILSSSVCMPDAYIPVMVFLLLAGVYAQVSSTTATERSYVSAAKASKVDEELRKEQPAFGVSTGNASIGGGMEGGKHGVFSEESSDDEYEEHVDDLLSEQSDLPQTQVDEEDGEGSSQRRVVQGKKTRFTRVASNEERTKSYPNFKRVHRSHENLANLQPKVGSFGHSSWGDEVVGGGVGGGFTINAFVPYLNGIKGKYSLTNLSKCITSKMKSSHLPAFYSYVGVLAVVCLSIAPPVHRVYAIIAQKDPMSLGVKDFAMVAFGGNITINFMLIVSLINTALLSGAFFLGLAVAERSYYQRCLIAKYFCALTSQRKAKRHFLPHFRLHKVSNIKMWLSLRAYLKRKGPQRSVDIIVSTTFFLALLLVAIIAAQFMDRGKDGERFLASLMELEILGWCLFISVFLLRFMTLGSRINRKYQNTSVLLTEQINLYLRLEQNPSKKAELDICNNVLKLATQLLKELESPYKISGLSMNPLLYNITRMVVLSAFSGILSEFLGFKLKLYKLKG